MGADRQSAGSEFLFLNHEYFRLNSQMKKYKAVFSDPLYCFNAYRYTNCKKAEGWIDF